MKLWQGRFSGGISQVAESFNSSIGFDYKLVEYDLKACIVHGEMLKKQGIISQQDGDEIVSGLNQMLKDFYKDKLEIDFTCEDIHTFIEMELTKRIGTAGKRLHTGRSRNDQVATACKLYVLDSYKNLKSNLTELIAALLELAKKNTDTIMPGYTHLQRAQPVNFAHYIMAYAQMFKRDIQRIDFAEELAKAQCPLGSGALAGTTYNIDRHWCAKELGFENPYENSMDGVSDRDFVLDIMHCCNLVMMHLSRFCEEIILWCSWEYGFISLDDSFSTGSSIMPQKKNPDIAELVRGKTGRVFGDMLAMLTVMKGLPLAYNKDMQEDKEGLFDSVETTLGCLQVFTPMVASMYVRKDNMKKAAEKGFMAATDCADYLVYKGMSFREAYQITGNIVGYCIENQETLESLELEEYKKFSDLFEKDIYNVINLENCVSRRSSYGAPGAVDQQITEMENFVKGAGR